MLSGDSYIVTVYPGLLQSNVLALLVRPSEDHI